MDSINLSIYFWIFNLSMTIVDIRNNYKEYQSNMLPDDTLHTYHSIPI